MPAVSHCPRCTALVSLPGGIDPSARVRCPLCEEEFPLREALDKAPPELIVVDRTGSPDLAPRDVGQVGDPPAIDGLDRRTASFEDAISSEDTASSDGLPAMPIDANAASRSGASPLESTTDAALADEAVDTSKESIGAIDSFEALDKQLDDQRIEELDEIPLEPPAVLADRPFALPGALPSEPIGSAGSATSSPVSRRSPSVLGTIVGIAGGGVCGLAIGYLVLLWIGGPSKDFLKIGADLPNFIVPSSFHVARNDEDSMPRLAAGSGTSDETEASLAMPGERPPGEGTSGDAASDASGRIAGQPESGSSAPQDEGSVATDVAPELAVADAQAARPPSSENVPPISDAPTYSLDDLAGALESARKAQAALVTGTLADRARRPAKANAYRAFSHLAEVTTFVRSDGSGAEVEPYRRAAANLVLDCAQTGTTFDQLTRIGEMWLQAKARSGRGAVLAGNIESIQRQGDHYLLQLRTGGQEMRRVLCGEPPRAEAGDRVVVLGAVETEPTSHIAGYNGPQETVVWAGQVVRIGPKPNP